MLLISALTKYILGVVLVGAMLFIPAGTFAYPGAWLFMALLFIPMLILGIFLYLRSPDLLKSRLDSKEKQAEQSRAVSLSGLMFTCAFVLSALDFRAGWSVVPSGVRIAASVIMLAAYAMYGEVMRENAYLSRTVQVQEGQRVIDTGLYGIVRHPMYTAAIFMFISIPIILGSWLGFCVMLVFPAIIVSRLLNEEKLLEKELAGYVEYKSRTKYRLIPFIW